VQSSEITKRYELLTAELQAIVLWNRIYLASPPPPDDEIERLAYRARQQRLMEIATELRDIELSMLGADKPFKNFFGTQLEPDGLGAYALFRSWPNSLRDRDSKNKWSLNI